MADTPFPDEIGMLCGCIPREPILAAGLTPRLITGSGSLPRNDFSLPSDLCAHVRRSASWIAGPEASTLAGLVVADGCHPMLRLRDYLQARGDAPDIRLLRVPRRHSPEAVQDFADELRMLARALSSLPGARPATADRLAEAIAREATRREDEAGRTFPGEPATPDRPDVPRILVRGSYFIDGDLVKMIRRLGADVVSIESCDLPRPGTAPLALRPEDDPFEALADWCLRRPPCPRSEGEGESRCEESPAPGRNGIDGVILLRMQNCTPQAYELPALRARLREEATPFLVLEIDGPDWNQAQTTMRIEAFIESLQDRILEPR